MDTAGDECTHKRQRKGFVKTKENEIANVADEAQWKERYFAAMELKNEADNDLASLFALKKECESALLSRIERLEEKNADLEKVLSQKEAAASTLSTKDHDSHVDKTVGFYEKMTGMTVEWMGGKFKCKVSNSAKRTCAEFLMAGDDEMTYEPTQNASIFPEYMHSDLAFQKDLAPTLMTDVLSSLFEDEDEEEA